MQTKAPPSPYSSTGNQVADAWIQGFTYRQTQAGAAKWEVVAKRAQIFEADHRAKLEDVTVYLYEKNSKQVTVEAEQGIIDTKTKNVDLENQEEFLPLAFQMVIRSFLNSYNGENLHIK